MSHRWSLSNNGCKRKGGALVRDCIVCGIEEVVHPPKWARTWYLLGEAVKSGISPPPCEAAGPTFTIVVSSERWHVKQRRGRSGDKIVAHGLCSSVAEGFAEAGKVVKP